MRAEQSYDELMGMVRDEATLASIEALLEWDEETSMPAGAVEGRSEQLALLAGLLHERGTDPRLGELQIQNLPVTLSRTPGAVRTPAPDVGQHTDEILGELGYSREEIAAIRRDGVV